MYFVNFTVLCPRDARIYKMQIRADKLPDGSLLPSPCNGCDFLNGSPVCAKCIEHIFKKSLTDPLMKSYPQPIHPFAGHTP